MPKCSEHGLFFCSQCRNTPDKGARTGRMPQSMSLTKHRDGKLIIQFGYSVKVPEGDIPKVDCRVIPNPYKIQDPVAQRYAVRNDPNFKPLVQEAIRLLHEHDVIAVGCAYGVHRSGMVVDEILQYIDAEVRRTGKL